MGGFAQGSEGFGRHFGGVDNVNGDDGGLGLGLGVISGKAGRMVVTNFGEDEGVLYWLETWNEGG